VAGDAAGNLALARHYVRVQRPERALEALARPGAEVDDPEFHELRGRALYELERYEDAKRAAQVGLAIDPHDITLLGVLCDCERELGDLAEAERALVAALDLAPSSPQLLCAYAHLCARGGQFKDAERLVAEAGAIDPRAVAVLQTRVWLAYLRGDGETTESAARTLLAAEPENALGLTAIGHRLATRGDARESQRHYELAAQAHTADADIVAAARAARIESHWLLKPLWPFRRFGAGRLWLAWIALLVLSGALNAPWLAIAAALMYIPLVIYSWIVPPIARRWLARRSR